MKKKEDNNNNNMIIAKHVRISKVKKTCQTFEYIAIFCARTHEYWPKSIPNIIDNNILIFNNLFAPLTENASYCSINRQPGAYTSKL